MNIFSSQPRGLHNFISEIRDCKSKEDERMRVDKELGNIRQKFSTSAALSSYQKKKYVWKLCYIFMLGYEVDFGHLEFISLLSATKFQEKSVGYMAVALFLKPGDQLMTLVINSIRNDIIGHLSFGKTLALSAVSNIGGNDLAEALSVEVQKLILESHTSHFYNTPAEQEAAVRANIRKKACLCLLRLYRTNPDCIVMEEWVPHLGKLLEDRDLGVITSAMSLLVGLTATSPETMRPLVPYVISILTRLVANRTCPTDYLYYHTPCPWLQVKCLRYLQYYECPDAHQKQLLFDVLQQILTKTDVAESNNKNNTDHSILFEAIHLSLSYGLEADMPIRLSALTLLGRFISVPEANIRYLGLELMNQLVKREGPAAVKSHKNTVLDSLKDTDISVRKRALELLYSLADEENAHDIVAELLNNLSSADSAIKEAMVVKLALLAERFSKGDMNWYIDTIVKVMLMAGDFVAEAVWYRVVLVVTNHPDTHEYTAQRLLECVKSKFAHDIAVALGGYLLGEIGHQVCERPGMTGYDQFAALHQHWSNSSLRTQAILLSTYVKLINLYPDTKEPIMEVFHKYATSGHLEIQQRSCEYLHMPQIPTAVMEQVLNEMPKYPEDKMNVLLTIEKKADNTDKSSWAPRAKEAAAAPAHSDGDADHASNLAGIKSPSSVKPATVDLLSMDDDVSPTSGAAKPSSAAVGITEAEEPKVKEWFKVASTTFSQKVTLFDNATITISSISDFRAHQARIQLLFYNKTNFDFSRFEVSTASSEDVVIRQQGPAVVVSAGDEGRVMLAVECMKPFEHPIDFTTSFFLGGMAYKYVLHLPMTIASYFEPVPSDKNTYMTRWKALENEVQEVFAGSAPFTANTYGQIRNTIFHGLKVGPAAELDANERSVTGSASFRTGTPVPGGDGTAFVSIGVMMRLEIDVANNKFRVTIRSKHPKVSSALKDVIKSLVA